LVKEKNKNKNLTKVTLQVMTEVSLPLHILPQRKKDVLKEKGKRMMIMNGEGLSKEVIQMRYKK
jgi:hypothetical protein